MMNGVIQITADQYAEMIAVQASTKALKRYDVSRKKTVAILGFWLNEGKKKC